MCIPCALQARRWWRVRAPSRTWGRDRVPAACTLDAWGRCIPLEPRTLLAIANGLHPASPASTSPTSRETWRRSPGYRSRPWRHDVQCLPLPSTDRPSYRILDRALQPSAWRNCGTNCVFRSEPFSTESRRKSNRLLCGSCYHSSVHPEPRNRRRLTPGLECHD